MTTDSDLSYLTSFLGQTDDFITPQELVATISFQELVKTTKLIKHCKEGHSQTIVRKHKYFRARLHLLPNVTEPQDPTARARLMIAIEVDTRLTKKLTGRSEICKVLLNTEVCNKNSGARLDAESHHPPFMKIPGRHVAYLQDLVSCDRLDAVEYRNDCVKLDFKIQLFVASSFMFSCRNIDDETAVIALH